MKLKFATNEDIEWSKEEISSLIKGVFRFGENEWSELIEDIDVHPSRSPNQLAIKWKQIKYLMN